MTPEQIIAEVADEFGYTVDELVGPSKARAVSTARSVAMYAVRKKTDLSFPEIGKLFNRDHSTIVTGCGRVEKLLSDHGVTLEQVVEHLPEPLRKHDEHMRFVEWEAELTALLEDRPSHHMAQIEGRDYYEDALALWAIEDVTPTLKRLLGKDRHGRLR